MADRSGGIERKRRERRDRRGRRELMNGTPRTGDQAGSSFVLPRRDYGGQVERERKTDVSAIASAAVENC
jgi:hypothetical protein